jgi:hypothetical protein
MGRLIIPAFPEVLGHKFILLPPINAYLKARIREAVAMVTSNMLQATCNEIEYCLDICRAMKGAHIEIY